MQPLQLNTDADKEAEARLYFDQSTKKFMDTRKYPLPKQLLEVMSMLLCIVAESAELEPEILLATENIDMRKVKGRMAGRLVFFHIMQDSHLLSAFTNEYFTVFGVGAANRSSFNATVNSHEQRMHTDSLYRCIHHRSRVIFAASAKDLFVNLENSKIPSLLLNPVIKQVENGMTATQASLPKEVSMPNFEALEQVLSVLRERFKHLPYSQVRPYLMDSICSSLLVSEEELKSKNRIRLLVCGRTIFCFFSRDCRFFGKNESEEQIASYVGIDRSTVFARCRVHQSLVRIKDKYYYQHLWKVATKLLAFVKKIEISYRLDELRHLFTDDLPNAEEIIKKLEETMLSKAVLSVDDLKDFCTRHGIRFSKAPW